MRRSTRFLTLLPALLLALCAAFAVAGCDTDSDADEADREKLRASWNVSDLTVDGEPSFASLDNQYPNPVLFRLRVDDAGRELFLIRARNDNGEDLLNEQGTFDVSADDSELRLDTSIGFIDLFYDFGASETSNPARIELEADTDTDGGRLLSLLGLEGFGDVESVEIAIQRR